MWRAVLATSLLAGCASTAGIAERLPFRGERTQSPDTALQAIEAAHVVSCPAGRALQGAFHEAFGPQHGVTSTDIALTPLAHDPSHALRLRRIEVEPGGVIAWHAHDQVQGMALLVSGQMTEIRSSCMDMMVYRAGDVAIEDAATMHGWRNDGEATAVILVSHVVQR
ncbi:MAG: cupin domain-containing protein [Hyphomonadaceae bacterium]